MDSSASFAGGCWPKGRSEVNPPRCAIYARVSLEDQAENYSLDSQLRELRQYASEKKFAVKPDWEFVDQGWSGSDLDRPALTLLRELARTRGIDLVLVLDVDRLSRNLARQLLLTEELELAGIRLEFLNAPSADTTEGRLMRNFKGVMAEYEREKIKERTLR